MPEKRDGRRKGREGGTSENWGSHVLIKKKNLELFGKRKWVGEQTSVRIAREVMQQCRWRGSSMLTAGFMDID